MNFDAEMINRIIRGIIGLVIVAAGIIYGSWIWVLGAFLLAGAVGGGCGVAGCSPIRHNRSEYIIETKKLDLSEKQKEESSIR
ncbi:MAG: hypothetical protein Q8940_21995 [Bacteroidota bacterium]|nr:hypothetical protein [Bacteroidota bacterium]